MRARSENVAWDSWQAEKILTVFEASLVCFSSFGNQVKENTESNPYYRYCLVQKRRRKQRQNHCGTLNRQDHYWQR